MTGVLGVVAATAVAGMGFASVFGASALLLPLAVVCAAVVLADVATSRGLVWLRAPLACVLALLGLAVVFGEPRGVPTADTWSALFDGISGGWLLTLESTWPARAEPETVAFVPGLVLAAAVAGVEALRHRAAPLVAAAPSLVVLVVSQLFAPAEGHAALLLGASYCAAVAAVLAAAAGRSRPKARSRAIPAVATGLAAVVGMAGLIALSPLDRDPYSLAEQHRAPTRPASVANPMTEVGARLAAPDEVSFVNRTDGPVDRWTIAVLDRFDGSSWSTTPRFQRLGSELPGGPARAPAHSADIEVASAPRPWLPTQATVTSVSGAAPLVDPSTGSLLSTQDTDGLVYRLDWRSPEIDPTALLAAPTAAAPTGQAQLPPEIRAVAEEATGGRGASVRTALQLEAWFRETYTVADTGDLPTGHGYPQIQYFLTTSKRGTSEQFASAYAVLARAVGIPARVAVGFRQPEAGPDGRHVVRNRDVLAWPEIQVSGVGWVALDPTGTAGAAGGEGVAEAIEKARKTLSEQPEPPPAPSDPDVLPPLPPEPPPVPSEGAWLLWTGIAVLVLLAAAAGAVPGIKWWRRRQRGARSAAGAVVGAWLEARDRMRDHGVLVPPGSPPGEIACGRPEPIARELRTLDGCLDHAVWSPAPVAPELVVAAWAASDAVRKELKRGPLLARVRSAYSTRGLRAGAGVR